MKASGGIGREGWRTLSGVRGGGHLVEVSGGIGREGWRTLSGGQWRDWQRGVEDTEWRPVEGLADTERLVRWMSLAAAFMID
ncbi:unnamed protein product [Staurois parvus]|uniref:Uncharacterized protein n=1 Tax=Staurois parvus TaxID=386267 RepID=A0ABN9AS25_9NEOB|nr:unnamed protein product [Staurois parvus]